MLIKPIRPIIRDTEITRLSLAELLQTGRVKSFSFAGGIASAPSDVEGLVSITGKGKTRDNRVLSSNMNVDTNADGIVDNFLVTNGTGNTVVKTLDSSAQKVEITDNTGGLSVQVYQQISVSPGEVISAKFEGKMSGNVTLRCTFSFFNGATFVSSVNGTASAPAGFAELKLENQTVPATATSVNLIATVATGAIGNLGSAWIKNFILEKAATVGSYISSGSKSTVSYGLQRVGKNFEPISELISTSGTVFSNKVRVDPSKKIIIQQRGEGVFRLSAKFYDISNQQIISGITFNGSIMSYSSGIWVTGADVTDTTIMREINAGQGIYWVELGITLKSGTSVKATERLISQTDNIYEPYGTQYVYANGTYRSVATANDEVSFGTTISTQNVEEDAAISGTKYDSLDNTTYTNVDVVKTTAFALAKAGTAAADGMTRYFNSAGVQLVEVAAADIDLVASIGKYYWHTDKTLWIVTAADAHADIGAARTALGTTKLQYELETPIITGIIDLKAGDTLIWIPSGNLEDTTVPEFTVYYFCR